MNLFVVTLAMKHIQTVIVLKNLVISYRNGLVPDRRF